MRKKTDLQKIKTFLRMFAKECRPTNFKDAIFTRHIIFESLVISDSVIPKTLKGKRENGFFFIDKYNFDEVVDWRCDLIDKSTDVGAIFIHIRKPDRITFFDFVKEFMNEKDYADILREIWMLTEFPHQTPNKKLIELFSNAKREYLIFKNDKKVWDKLEDTFKVYRGIQEISKKKGRVKALSWTLDIEKAKWFSNRFEKNGEVFEAEIDKDDCFSYNDGRSEKEIILNPNKLRNIRQMRLVKKV